MDTMFPMMVLVILANLLILGPLYWALITGALSLRKIAAVLDAAHGTDAVNPER